MAIKHYLPQGLLGRSLLIMVTPLFVLQAVAALIFFENHWQKVSRRLAADLAGDIAVLVDTVRDNPEPGQREAKLQHVAGRLGIAAALRPAEVMEGRRSEPLGSAERNLYRALDERLRRPVWIDTSSLPERILVKVQLPEGVLRLITSRKRLFSTTTTVFVLWMVGTSLIVVAVAVIFLRNQVKPIHRLARAADAFGKGRDAPQFKPEGAKEIRQAAAAFIAMRQRILRQISQRTTMLAGVSHDLRTPLTRMKLQLEMMHADEGVAALKEDVVEMGRMLDAYLAFARGEGSEKPRICDVALLLEEVIRLARRKGATVSLHTEGEMRVSLRPIAFRRCVTNLLDNAVRYGSRVAVAAALREQAIEITIDDNGPGIAADRREEVFRPFFRLESSRNPGTGGVGLGLTIARDVARSHGGDVVLGDAPAGGLRARISLPL